jgi:hypothetical protein
MDGGPNLRIVATAVYRVDGRSGPIWLRRSAIGAENHSVRLASARATSPLFIRRGTTTLERSSGSMGEEQIANFVSSEHYLSCLE